MSWIVLNPVFKPRQWQDTSSPPNLILFHLGPGLTALPLAYVPDLTAETFSRDSVKGQVPDVPNALVLHPGPPVQSILNLQDISPTDHRESMRGQVGDPPNILLTNLGLKANPGQPGSVIFTPVLKRAAWQDTTVPANLVITLSNVGAFPFRPLLSEDAQNRKQLSGQDFRATIYLPKPTPFVYHQDAYVQPERGKPTQPPYDFPNLVILGIAPTPQPFIQQQFDDRAYKGQTAQVPYDLPNLVALNLKPTSPFVQSVFPDLQGKAQQVQATFDFPNLIIYEIPPAQAPQLIIAELYEAFPSRSAKTQEHFDFPNVLAYTLPVPVAPGFRVMAVQPGTYGGLYYQIGDVFDIAISTDYSAYNIDYGPGSGTTQFGWMMQVPPSTPLLTAEIVQIPAPLFPVSDPVPPVRTVY